MAAGSDLRRQRIVGTRRVHGYIESACAKLDGERSEVRGGPLLGSPTRAGRQEAELTRSGFFRSPLVPVFCPSIGLVWTVFTFNSCFAKATSFTYTLYGSPDTPLHCCDHIEDLTAGDQRARRNVGLGTVCSAQGIWVAKLAREWGPQQRESCFSRGSVLKHLSNGSHDSLVHATPAGSRLCSAHCQLSRA